MRADSAYGDQDGFRGELAGAGLPFVLALKPRRGTWAYGADAHTPAGAARALAWHGPAGPGEWRPVTRAFRGGHTKTWHAGPRDRRWVLAVPVLRLQCVRWLTSTYVVDRRSAPSCVDG